MRYAGMVLALFAGGVLACGPAGGVATAPEPAKTPAVPAPAPSVPVARAEGGAPRRSVDPATALARGWMPLAPTGVLELREKHPTYDGRGVLIAILDSGIDPGVEGLDSTSTGTRKLLDLRDFSGEGRVVLHPVAALGDTLRAGGPPLTGMTAARSLAPDSPWYTGSIAELRLGPPPAADLNGDGDARDTLAIAVARDSIGWFLLTDIDLDGSLAGERPIRDYAHDEAGSFAWAGGRPARLNLVANFSENDGAPVLDLLFDTSGHGTHVAGIAAGHRIYGTAGFDGVAPGAQLLGLKIANNARGGVSATGSMRAAMAYAIRFARERGMPLVVNLSFGVGNEREGAARIDAIIDSVLAANPEVVFTISAGNDGPGLSTVGFPGSARRALSIGATVPGAFTAAPGASTPPERVAYFSARGGETGKPDLVAPGIAYSTVPRWNAGNERSSGTSMAAPHAAGLAALLASGLVQSGRTVRGDDIGAALMATAKPLANADWPDQGVGLPDVSAAWRWLEEGHRAPDITVRIPGVPGRVALHRAAPGGVPAAQPFEVLRPRNAPRATYRLKTDAAWLGAPDSVNTGAGASRIVVRYDRDALSEPGVWTAAVTGWSADTAAGPAFRLLNAIVVPYPAGAPVDVSTGDLEPAEPARVFFVADTARPFRVSVTGTGAAAAFLHEPGGQPYRAGHARPAGSGARAAVFDVDAADVVDGAYEVVVVPAPARAAAAAVSVRHAPVLLAAVRSGDVVRATIASAGADSVAGDAMLLLVGGERRLEVGAQSGGEQSVPLHIPDWAVSATIDVRHPAGQWERFTDFGVTVLDEHGVVIEQAPMNYAFGRLTFPIDESVAGTDAALSLLAGLADRQATPWSVDVSVRFYAEAPVAVAPVEGPGASPLTLAPGATARLDYPVTDGPWPLDAGFHSLAVLVAEIGGVTWSREIGLPEPALSEVR